MGTSLNGLTPAGTYPGLIKTGDNAPIDGTLKTLSDGNGNNLPMSVSTTTINLTGTAQVGGVAIANTTQVAAKQDTLVSGTNIKTINGTSLLGSGNIPVVTSPSGVAGAIQFSNGSAFASDATNLFWDDTNNRLGIGTNAPNTALDISASLTSIFTLRNGATNFITTRSSGIAGVDTGLRIWENSNNFTLDLYGSGSYDHPQRHRFYIGGAAGERLLVGSSTAVTIKGSGSTPATTSLLVQNSAGNNALQVTDDQMVRGYSGTSLRFRLGTTTVGQGVSTREGEFAVGFIDTNQSSCLRLFVASSTAFSYIDGYTEGASKAQNYAIVFGSRANNTGQVITGSTTQENGSPVVFGSAVVDASALVQINSTTRGFLPPRMTTTQKNAIATPAAGLVVYDSTTNKLQCYNGSTWNDLF